MSRILRLYVIREIALPSGLALLTITFLLLIGIVYEFIGLLLQPTISVWSVAQMLLLLLPGYVTFALPMAVLMGSLIGVGRMTLDREVLAIRASGVNLFHVFAPTLVLAFVISLLILYASGNMVPVLQGRGMTLAAQLQFELIQSLEPGRFHSNPGGTDSNISLYFKDRAATDDRTMQKVVLKMEEKYEPPKPAAQAGATTAATPAPATQALTTSTQLTTATQLSLADLVKGRDSMLTIVLAERGDIQTRITTLEEAGRQGVAIILTLYNGTINRLVPDPTETDNVVIRFQKLEKRLFTKNDLRKPYQTLTNGELKVAVHKAEQRDAERIAKAAAEGRKVKDKQLRIPARSELVERHALSLAFFVFALLGVPLAIWVKPSGKSWGILLAIGLMLVYYVLLKVGSAMVEVGNPLGVMVAFSPNLLFTLLGAGLWWHNLRS